MATKRPSARVALAVLVALALIPRLAVIFMPRADLYGPGTPESPSVYIGEELYRGNLGVEYLQGPLLPVLDYQYAKFFGGAVVVGALAAPVFAVFGARLWALKLVPVAFHLVALFLLFRILDRFVSRRAAWIGGLLMALTPPGYTLITTIAWGTHMESNVLAMLCTYLFLDLHSRTDGRIWSRVLFGVAAGFSVWFGYQCLLFLAVLAVLDLLVDWRGWLRRELLPQAAGFLIGFSPWIVYNLRYDFEGLSVYSTPLFQHFSGAERAFEPLRRVGDLVVHGIPYSFYFRDRPGLDPWMLGLACLAGLGALALAAAWQLRAEVKRLLARPFRAPTDSAPPHPGLIGLGFVVAFLMAVAFSDFQLPGKEPAINGIRYVMPLFPFLFLAAASGADLVLQRFPALTVPIRGVVAGSCVVSALAMLSFVDVARLGADRDMSAAPGDGMGRWLVQRFSGRLDKLERIVDRAAVMRTPEEQEDLYLGMGKFLRFFSDPQQSVSARDRAHFEEYRAARGFLRDRVPAAYRHHFE